MYIKKIRLKNIKSYIDETIEFSEGINFISGANGAGKTTLIEGIGFALFDCKPYHPIRMFIRNGRAVGQIDVWFEANDEREYKVVRKMGRGSSQWTVYDVETDAELCDSSADVNDWLSDFIEIDPGIQINDLFKNVIGVKQGSFTSPFLLSPNERKNLFDSILKVDNYKNAFEKTRDAEAIFRNEMDKTELLINEKIKQIERYDEIKELFEQVNKQMEESRKEINRIDGRLEIDFQKFNKMETLKKRLQECVDEINKTNTCIEVLKTRLEQAKSDVKESQKADKILDQFREEYKSYVEQEKEIRKLEVERKKREQLQLQINKLEREIAIQKTRIKTKEEDYKKRSSELHKEKLENQKKLQELTQHINFQKNEVKKFNNLFASFNESFKVLSKLKNSLNEFSAERSQIELKIEHCEKIKDDIRKLENSLSDYNEQKFISDRLPIIDSQLQATQNEIENISTQIRLAKSNKEKAKGGMCPLLGERCKNIGGESLEKYFAQQIDELTLKLSEPQKKVQQLKNERQTSQSAKDNIIRMEQNREKISALNKELKKYEDDILNINTKAKFETIQKQIQTIQEELNNLKIAISSKIKDCYSSILKSLKLCVQIPKDKDSILVDWLKLENLLESYLESVNAELQKKYEEKQNIFRLVQMKLQRLETQKESFNTQQKKLELSLSELEKQKQEFSYEKKELYTKISILNRYEEQISLFGDLDDILEKAHDKLIENRQAYQNYVKNEDIAKKLVERQQNLFSLTKKIEVTEKRLKEIEDEKRQINSQFSTYTNDENDEKALADGDGFYLFEKLASLQNIISEKKQEKIRYQTVLENLFEKKKRLQDEISRMNSVKEEIEKLKSKLSRYEKGYHILRFIRFQLLNRAGEEIAERYVRSISMEASRIYREVSKENVMLYWGKDYEIILTNKEGKRTRKRTFKQLSGGEQMTAALAVRMALLNSLSKVRLGIFDEPTINMDEERKNNFASALSALKNNFEQLFIISHDDTFDTITENLITIEKNEEKGSVIVNKGSE
ncbi:MAG: AAA family ATPase [Candidatus Heimdallarchaeaceae archaeon]